MELGAGFCREECSSIRWPSASLAPQSDQRFLCIPCEGTAMCQPMQRTFIWEEDDPNLGVIGGVPFGSNIPLNGHYYGLVGGGVPSTYNFMPTHDQGINQIFSNKGSDGGQSSNSSFLSQDVVRGHWTTEEDRLLIKLVNQNGVQKWSQIAKKMVGRVGKQCRERWYNHLRPDIKKDIWSEKEERLLVEAHKKMGNKWAEISKLIPGRTENSVKNHWNATKRRQTSSDLRRSKMGSTTDKKKAKSSKSSLLQEYIQSGGYKEHCNTNTSPWHTLDQHILPLPQPWEPMSLCLPHPARTSAHHVYDQSLLTSKSSASGNAVGGRGSHGVGTYDTTKLDSVHLMGFNNKHVDRFCIDAENDFPASRDCHDILLKQDGHEVLSAALDFASNSTNNGNINHNMCSDMYLPSLFASSGTNISTALKSSTADVHVDPHRNRDMDLMEMVSWQFPN